MDQPLVSVVVATYQRPLDLRRALKSIAEQTYPFIEVVIVDDSANTQDNAAVAAIVEELRAQRRLEVILITNEINLGSAEARNRGIQSAKGEYITFLDDDDIYLPQKIQSQLTKMLMDGADYSLTDLILYNEQDKPSDQREHRDVPSKDPQKLMTYHLMYHLTGTDCMMFKKEYLLRIGGFPGINVGDEFYLMNEAIQGGGSFCYYPECYVKAYVHTGENGGLSSGEGKIHGENALFEYKKQYFNALDVKAIRYIKMRHHAVLSFAYLRMNRNLKCLWQGLRAFLYSPSACLTLLKQQKRIWGCHESFIDNA